MTKSEFIELYKDTYFNFSNYWKFSFSYTGKTVDDKDVHVSVGGNPDDIYRVELTSEETIGSLLNDFNEDEIDIMVDGVSLK